MDFAINVPRQIVLLNQLLSFPPPRQMNRAIEFSTLSWPNFSNTKIGISINCVNCVVDLAWSTQLIENETCQFKI